MNVVNLIWSAIITAITTAFIKTLKNTVKEFKVIQRSQRIMIKDRLVSAHDYFCSKGNIGKYSLETLEELFGEYAELGGNGFIKSMMNDIRNLKIK